MYHMKIKKNKKQKTNKKYPFQDVGIGKEKEYLIENLSMLVDSGMGILPALESIKVGMKTKRMKTITANIVENVGAGLPLWKAINQAGIFPSYMMSLIRVGEESGGLSENLKVIALQNLKERQFKSKIRSAMMYPLFVLFLTLFVGVGIAWFILPRLALVFSQLSLELPTVTRVLIIVGKFLQENGKIVVPIFFLFVILVLYILFFYRKTKFIGQTILFKVPGVNRLIQEVEIARFGYLLGSLFESGLPIVHTFESLEQATSFPIYRKFYAHVRVSIEEGNSFKKSFESYKSINRILPAPIQQMIVTAEKSGNLASTLRRVGTIYEDKTEITTKNLTVILEPILLVIVWLGVVAVALAVILPIYSLIGGFGA